MRASGLCEEYELIKINKMIRVGFGYDVHRLVEGRDFWMGGIKIPYKYGLDGHSDADVLIHAICDAMLGAANLGDIGRHFPDNSSEFHGIDSKILLSRTNELINEAGYKLVNIDTTIVAQQPKLSPYIPHMQQVLADVLEVDIDVVSIKATTTERLGFEGRKEGISAYAVVLIEK